MGKSSSCSPASDSRSSQSGPGCCCCSTEIFALCRSQSSFWCSSVICCSIVPTVTKRQMWIFRLCPGRRTRPTAWSSKATASSRVAASMGCTMITWFAAVRFVPLADSSSDSSNILGPPPSPSSYWNRVSAALRAQTLPCKLRCSTPNSSSARPILRLRSSHWMKQMILQEGSWCCSRCTCRTNASILLPYFAKGAGVSSWSPDDTAATCEACSVC
mmetsp:Transcript_14504/g.36755  ORF Transcript_14504/g.36755 Transcript_14504/m.36755 type:complete len:216 (+) Transcript_14504:124-771(+)